MLLLVIGAVIGVVLDRGYTLYSTRPKLIFSGTSSGGSGSGTEMWNVAISNMPGLFGIRLQESTLFGKPVHGFFQKGLLVERNTARQCMARLHDKENGDAFIAQLYWWMPQDRPAWQVIRDIESGQDQIMLRLFNRAPDGSLRYFPFSPADPNDPGSPPRVPEEAAWIDRSHRFEVRISYSYGAQTTRIGVDVTVGLNGQIDVQYRP